jgi:hypothetical protein
VPGAQLLLAGGGAGCQRAGLQRGAPQARARAAARCKGHPSPMRSSGGARLLKCDQMRVIFGAVPADGCPIQRCKGTLEGWGWPHKTQTRPSVAWSARGGETGWSFVCSWSNIAMLAKGSFWAGLALLLAAALPQCLAINLSGLPGCGVRTRAAAADSAEVVGRRFR